MKKQHASIERQHKWHLQQTRMSIPVQVDARPNVVVLVRGFDSVSTQRAVEKPRMTFMNFAEGIPTQGRLAALATQEDKLAVSVRILHSDGA